DRRRQDADDGELFGSSGITPEEERRSDYLRIGVQSGSPEAVADRHDAILAFPLVVLRKRAAQLRLDAERREKARRRALSRDVLRIAARIHVEARRYPRT